MTEEEEAEVSSKGRFFEASRERRAMDGVGSVALLSKDESGKGEVEKGRC